MKTFKQFNEAILSKTKVKKQKDKIATHDKPLFKSVPATGVRGDQPASDYLRNAAGGGLIKGGTPNDPYGINLKKV